MLVDINLLPKKEQKNIKRIIILLAALLLVSLAGFFLLWQGKSYNQQLSSLDNQISTTQKLAEIEQEKVMAVLVSNSVTVLESAVNWASEDPLKTVPIIQHVTSLLPQRGFIQNISYSETGTVSLTVQFDTSRDAAYYLKTLLNSQWFSEVKLGSVTSTELETAGDGAEDETETEEGAETPAEQTAVKTDDENSDVENTEKQAESEADVTAAEETPKAKEEKNKELLPRYIGTYQLQLHREYINGQQKEKSSVATSEGGDPS
jgi:type IV pilus assembly protein PilN